MKISSCILRGNILKTWFLAQSWVLQTYTIIDVVNSLGRLRMAIIYQWHNFYTSGNLMEKILSAYHGENSINFIVHFSWKIVAKNILKTTLKHRKTQTFHQREPTHTYTHESCVYVLYNNGVAVRQFSGEHFCYAIPFGLDYDCARRTTSPLARPFWLVVFSVRNDALCGQRRELMIQADNRPLYMAASDMTYLGKHRRMPLSVTMPAFFPESGPLT